MINKNELIDTTNSINKDPYKLPSYIDGEDLARTNYIPLEFRRVSFKLNGWNILIIQDVKNYTDYDFSGEKIERKEGIWQTVKLPHNETKEMVTKAFNEGYFQINNFDLHTIAFIEASVKDRTEQKHLESQLWRLHK